MLWFPGLATKQESVSLVTMKFTAIPVIPELGLVQDILTSPTRVETWHGLVETMAPQTSKPWDTL